MDNNKFIVNSTENIHLAVFLEIKLHTKCELEAKNKYECRFNFMIEIPEKTEKQIKENKINEMKNKIKGYRDEYDANGKVGILDYQFHMRNLVSKTKDKLSSYRRENN